MKPLFLKSTRQRGMLLRESDLPCHTTRWVTSPCCAEWVDADEIVCVAELATTQQSVLCWRKKIRGAE
jgi:hypothetical protein